MNHNTLPTAQPVSQEKPGKLGRLLDAAKRIFGAPSVNEVYGAAPMTAGELIDSRGYAAELTGHGISDTRSYGGTLKRIANADGAVIDRGISDADEIVEINEHDAVGQTVDFLASFSKTVRDDTLPSDAAKEFADIADTLVNGLDYITQEDLQTATAGLASYWVDYLSEDARNRILVIGDGYKSRSHISKMVTMKVPEELRGRIDHQRTAYEDAAAVKAEQKGAPFTDNQYREYVDHIKPVVVDDWMATGSQISLLIGNDARMALSFGQQAGNGIRDELEDVLLNKVEINLCVATDEQTTQGITAQEGAALGRHFTVKGFWRKQSTGTIPSYAYDADGYAYQRPRPVRNLITGAHSSTDDALEKPCAEMVKILRAEYSLAAQMPPLTNLVRPYR